MDNLNDIPHHVSHELADIHVSTLWLEDRNSHNRNYYPIWTSGCGATTLVIRLCDYPMVHPSYPYLRRVSNKNHCHSMSQHHGAHHKKKYKRRPSATCSP